MIQKLSIRDLNLKDKKVLLRVDFNVPLSNGKIEDDSRIRASLKTIQYILNQGGIPILMSHLGRPGGKRSVDLSLKPCGDRLKELLGRPVQFTADCCGKEVEKQIAALKSGAILLLENVRFHPGEENPNLEPGFASSLAQLGDLFVNDAFGSSHRSHSSVTGITAFFPNKSARGFLLEKEINYLDQVVKNPKRPFYALLGGSKISTKFKVIESLMKKADVLLIGGAMAFNFLKAQGFKVGDSLVEEDSIPTAKDILEKERHSSCRLVLPIDLVIAKDLSASSSDIQCIKVEEGIPAGWKGFDIGPATIKLYQSELQKAQTVFWNGPMGVFETAPFDFGTYAIAKILTEISATTIVGGGDSVSALQKSGFSDKIDHLSTGGGASLEYIELGTLPGIEALS